MMAVMIEELRIAAFCTGASGIDGLRKAALRRHDSWEVV